MRRIILGSIMVFLLLSIETKVFGSHSWVIENAPEIYVVKQGDTLWDIACLFLKDPWRWQEVWCANPDIENPNFIYPGDRLYLSYVEGKPRIEVERGKSSETVDKRTGVVKLRPRVRELPPDNAIPTIAMNVIAPFFNQSRVVSKIQATKSPFVAALEVDHIAVGMGDRLYVDGISECTEDDVFTIFRAGKRYFDPVSKEGLGIEALVVGKAERELPGDPSRWIVTESFADIQVGDRLIATLEEEVNAYFVPKLPAAPAVGSIISVFDGITQIGQFQVIVITGGEDKNREVGDVLDIEQNQIDPPNHRWFDRWKIKYRIPTMNVGRCVVFRVFDSVSYALVMSAIKPIYLHDTVASP